MVGTKVTQTPEDYAELFELYFDYIQKLVIKRGIRPNEAPDVASDILLRFMDQDFLSKYDPNKMYMLRSGRIVKTRFVSFLSGFVSKYVMQYRDRQKSLMEHEPLRIEAPIGEDGTMWIDVFGGSHSGDYEIPEFVDRIQGAYQYLQSLPVRGTRDLAKVFRMVVQQVILDGSVDRQAIAEEFGVSATAVCLYFSDLRTALRNYGFCPEAV